MNARRHRLVLVGTGGHAKVVASVLRLDPRFDLAGAVGPPGHDEAGALARLGDDEDLPHIRDQGIEAAFIAVGENTRREVLFSMVERLGFSLPTAIHPRATVDSTACIGRGVVIMAGAVVNADSVVEDAAIINTGTTVDHDCTVGRAAHLAPGVHLSGYVTVGRLALVGIGATVGRGKPLRIGEGAVVGAGSVVIRDVLPFAEVVGVPARDKRGRSEGPGGAGCL